jgi:hypothetical protein
MDLVGAYAIRETDRKGNRGPEEVQKTLLLVLA